MSNGGANSSARPSSRRISSRSTAAIACAARSGAAAPESTAQDCAIASMRHSSLAAEPSGSPSSKKARRYQSPSHASRSSEARKPAACAVHFAARSVSPARLSERNEGGQRRVQEPAEPDAFARALFADAVHAVVPVAGSHQRKPVAAERQAGVEGERAMLEQCRRPVGDDGREEAVGLAGLQRLAFEERDRLVEDGEVGRDVDVMGDGEGQPRAIVGDAGAHALAGMRQPPMLNVAFDELAPRGAQQVLARQRRAARRPAPCRPAIDREIHRRRSPGRRRSAPRCGNSASGRSASR